MFQMLCYIIFIILYLNTVRFRPLSLKRKINVLLDDYDHFNMIVNPIAAFTKLYDVFVKIQRKRKTLRKLVPKSSIA